ncbi:MAG: MBL fold metallo-hydrolase [Planctomycetales bacterium]|nr:MAG: MBL fold metallo-hydrolase [Planctomycetales bacterium]
MHDVHVGKRFKFPLVRHGLVEGTDTSHQKQLNDKGVDFLHVIHAILEIGSKLVEQGPPIGTLAALREERVRQIPVPEQNSGIQFQDWGMPERCQVLISECMQLRIFDVEHGDSILILSNKNEAVLVDCGWNHTTGWRVSDGLAKQGFGIRRKLHHVIITHPDQDHVADLPNVLEKLKPVHVWQHPQLYLKNISELKATLSQAQSAYLASRKSTAELQPREASRQFRTMELHQFYLPVGSVRDVNDLSLVTFLKEDGFTVCLPGDLNARGWRLHLQNKAFQYWLRETNLFFASHHGRMSGYLDKVFEYLSPKLIAISDKEQTKGRTVTQRAPYTDHSRGVKMKDGSFRRVLTTRGDGRIKIVVKDGNWEISTSRMESTNKGGQR